MRRERKSCAPALYALVIIPVCMVAMNTCGNLGVLIARSQVARAQADIEAIDLAMARLRVDVGTETLQDVFEPDAFANALREHMGRSSLNTFEASVDLYSTATHALLRHGRNAPDKLANVPETRLLAQSLSEELSRKASDHYLTVSTDPWGKHYRFFFGPYPDVWGPSVFRIREVPNGWDAPLTADPVTVSLSSDGTNTPVGFPVPRHKPLYVWSYGLNRQSDQAQYDPTHEYQPPARQYYRPEGRDLDLGGGDDVGNWSPSFFDLGRDALHERISTLKGCAISARALADVIIP